MTHAFAEAMAAKPQAVQKTRRQGDGRATWGQDMAGKHRGETMTGKSGDGTISKKDGDEIMAGEHGEKTMAGRLGDEKMTEENGGQEMAGNVESGDRRFGSRWRIDAWTAAGLILLVPFLAMQVTDEVAWDTSDFAFFGALVVGVGVTYELAARMRGDTAYRAGVGVALAAAFILVWVNGAVGIIGSEENPANLMYFGVLAVGIIGAFNARFQPRGMARALFASALAQALVAVIALIAGLGLPWSGPGEIVILNGFFVALFVGSALLFRKAARGRLGQGAL